MKRWIGFLLSILLVCSMNTGLFSLCVSASNIVPEGFSLRAENSNFALYLNQTDGNFAVLSKQSGELTYAFPPDASQDPYAIGNSLEKLQSLLVLSYSDVSGVVNEMNSCYDAVGEEQMSIDAIENGVAITLLLGNKQSRVPVPMVIGVREFNAVLRALEEDTDATDRLKYFYRYINLNKIEDPEEKQELIEEYPGLRKSDMFVCSDLNEAERLELEEYYKKAGFTLDKVDEEYELLDYEEKVEPTPWFEFQLRIELFEEGFTVSLPKEHIQYDSKNYSLYTVTLLPYFNSVKAGSGGYIFIPDQSGRQIVADGRSYSAPSMSGKVYGRDYADFDDDTSTVRFQLPIYVTKNGNTAVLTEIIGGEANATITAETAGFSHGYFAVYPTFTYQHKVYFTAENNADSSFTMFEKNSQTPDVTLKFTFISENDGEIYTVADVYRQSLIKRTEKLKGDIPLFISTLGSIDTKLDILFFSFKINNTLTSFEDNKAIIDALQNAGVSNIAMELQGIANGGLNHTAFSKYQIMNNLGGSKGLETLISYATEKKVSLFPTVDLTFVRNLGWFNGYDVKQNGNRTVDGKAAIFKRISVSSGQESDEDVLMTVNSNSARNYFEKIFRTITDLGIKGLSFGQMGNTVMSNFSKADAINRNTQVSDYEAILSQTGMPQMFSGANAYAILHGSYFSEIPYDNTSVYNFGDKVLFLQAVLHGYADYSIEKLNLSEDLNTAILRCIETGASPDFTVLYRNAKKLRQDDYFSGYYSSDFAFWKDKIVSSYQQINTILKQVRDATIVGYQAVTDGVTATRYSNGKTVLVNYTGTDYEYQGTVVKAESATVKEG